MSVIYDAKFHDDEIRHLKNIHFERLMKMNKTANELSAELASYKADAIRLLGEKVRAEKERDRLRMGFDAACAFIDCHAADPDITAEMCAKYAIFDSVRDEIERG